MPNFFVILFITECLSFDPVIVSISEGVICPPSVGPSNVFVLYIVGNQINVITDLAIGPLRECSKIW